MNGPSSGWSWPSRLRPKGSHVLLCVLASIGALVASWGAELVGRGETYQTPGFVIFFTGIAIIFVVVLAWKYSYKDRELAGGLAEMQRTADGKLSIRSDVRLYTDPNALRGFAAILSTAAHMQPLPPAAGTVDAEGRVVPNSEQEAATQTMAINAKAQQLIDLILDTVSVQRQELDPSVAIRQPSDQPASLLNQETARNEAGAGPLPHSTQIDPLS